jgi:hypothetical protein
MDSVVTLFDRFPESLIYALYVRDPPASVTSPYPAVRRGATSARATGHAEKTASNQSKHAPSTFSGYTHLRGAISLGLHNMVMLYTQNEYLHAI